MAARFLAVVGVCLTMSVAAHARADEPRLQVFGGAGVGSTVFAGEVGEGTTPGMRLQVLQGVQGEHWGGYLRLGSTVHLVDSPPPPFIRHLRTYAIEAGARYGVGRDELTYLFGVEFSRLFLISNAFVDATGERSSLNGPGTTAAIRWDGLRPLFVELELSGHAYLDAERPLIAGGLLLTLGLFEGI